MNQNLDNIFLIEHKLNNTLNDTIRKTYKNIINLE